MLVLALLKLAVSLDPAAVQLAIYPGDDPYKGRDGVTYESDRAFASSNSNKVDYSQDPSLKRLQVKYTNDPTLFRHERHSYQSLEYQLPIKSGTYTLVVRMAEMFFRDSGKRVFDIYLGEDILEQDVDVYAQVGFGSALEFHVEIQIDNQLTVKGKIFRGAFHQKKLRLSFRKGKADNPIVNAIVLLKGTKEKAVNQYKNIVDSWKETSEMRAGMKQDNEIKERLSRLKNKQKTLIRNDQLSSLE